MKKLILILVTLLTLQNTWAQKSSYKKAVDYFKKAHEFKAKSDFKNALLNYNKAAKLFKTDYPGNYIQSKYSYADILIHTNNYNKAYKILSKLKNFSITNFGEKNKFLVQIYYGQGIVNYYKSLNNEALELFKNAEAINDSLPNKNAMLTANIYSGLGNVFSAEGNYILSLGYYNKDIEIRKQVFGEDNPGLALAYNNLSVSYRNLGNFEKALIYINKALDIRISTNGTNDLETAKYYSSKGNIYFDTGQNDLALEFYLKALKIKLNTVGKRQKTVADEYNNIGLVYKSKQNYRKAITYFKDAYEIQTSVLGEAHSDIALTCNNIALVLKAQEKYESALSYYNKAIKIKTKHFGNNHPDLAAYYNNIGIIHLESGKYDEAIKYSTKATNILKLRFGNKFQNLVNMYSNIAEALYEQKKYHESLQFYQKSLVANVIYFKPDSLDYYANPVIKNYSNLNKLLLSLKGKAKTLNAMYVKDSLYQYIEHAYYTYIKCDSTIDIAKRKTIKTSDKITLGNKAKIIYEDAASTAMALAYIQKNDTNRLKYFLKALYFSEKNKATVLSEAISTSQAKRFADIPDSVILEDINYKTVISSVENKILETSNRSVLLKLNDLLFELNQKYRQFTNELEQKYVRYYNAKYKNTNIDFTHIQKTLNDSTAILSYFLGSEKLIIFTVTNTKITATEKEIANEFDTKINKLIKSATTGTSQGFQKYLNQSNYFYKILIPKSLNKNIKNLIIIPDGKLNLIPFELLTYENYEGKYNNFHDYPYLIKKYMCSYFFSGDLYYKSLNNNYKDTTNRWLGIAPVFKNIKNRRINGIYVSKLPGTEKEVNNIAKIFNNTKKLLSNKASETGFKKEDLSSYKYIHIATHGTVNIENPQLSGLLLYPEKEPNDGILFSSEIYNLRLNSDLVVLSACETGVGKISKSEGIVGLSRALLYAGAKNVIVSMWKVADNSTAELMLDFYKNIVEKKQSYTAALHNAKLKMIKTKSNFSHPYFWSPFILIGR